MFAGKPLSKWLVGHKMGKASSLDEDRAVFVDEVACIGCKQCVWSAAGTFRVEANYGRSRVFAQWIDPEDKIEVSVPSAQSEHSV